MVIPDTLRNIAQTLENAQYYQRVTLENGIISVETALSKKIYDFVINWIPCIGCCFLRWGKEENSQDVLDYFKDIFGEDRVQAISNRYGLDFQEKVENEIPITVRDIQALFVGVGDVRREDIEAHTKKQLENLSKNEIDEAYEELIPFEAIEHIFLNNIPEVTSNSSRGNDFDGRLNRVYLTEEMRRKWDQFSALDGIEDAPWHIRVMKRLLNDDLPTGVMIPHSRGYYVNQGVVAAGGAFAVLLKSIIKTDDLRSQIAFLSTRTNLVSFLHFRSLFEIFHQNIGANGAISIHPLLKEITEDPDHPTQFVKDSQEEYDVIGMSLGGAHAQRYGCLEVQRIGQITTVASAGIDEATLDYYRENFQLKIRHYVWLNDAVSGTGEGLLGNPEDDEEVMFVGIDSDPGYNPTIEEAERGHAPQSAYQAFVQMFWDSMFNVHSEESLGLGHQVVKIQLSNKNPDQKTDLAKLLRTDRGWEEWREDLPMYWGDRCRFIKYLEGLEIRGSGQSSLDGNESPDINFVSQESPSEESYDSDERLMQS